MAEPRFPVVNLSLPTVLSGSGAREYLISELQALANTLASRLGSAVTENTLRASIACYNQQRHLLSRVDRQRGRLTAKQWWSLTAAGMLIPVEEHIALLESVLADLEGSAATEGAGPRLVVVGAVLDEPVALELIDELGGRVVADDLCTGSRYFDRLVDESAAPYEALAGRYLQRAPCPVKHAAAQSRAQRLLAMCEDASAQGVVFVLPKFCEPHAFDYVPLTDMLDEAGVPHLLIETDVSTPVGQLRTRLQAFMEMLDHHSG
jgi:benzoyl-CoA reductase/2-hydroxyglutaryl-CoA dehydratase subunit BcrC/BadD/HgdB